MKLFSTLLTLVAMTCSATATAQTISFETEDYRAIGVYDGWVKSPFRTGELKGNAAVVDNHLNTPDPITKAVYNPSAKMLAVQRSRFGSNTFGVRVDLKTPLVLTTKDQYVHVLINTPSTHRILLIGLGKRRERMGQSPETEQFWELPMNKIVPGEWNDAVFAIRGANGIDIHSFVIVPDLASPHDLTQDFAAYVDEITVSNDYAPRIQKGAYPVNVDKEQQRTRNDRPYNAITLTTTSGGLQKLNVSQDRKVYTERTDFTFVAKAGDDLTVAIDFPKRWMHGYVYLDKNNDGKFAIDLNEDHTPAANSDILGYSYCDAFNSAGEALTERNILNPPAMKLPSDLAPGTYRLRVKVDWDMLDPGGRVTSDNNIVGNGGAITDALLKVRTDEVFISDNQLNGEILAADGSKLNNYRAPYGKAFTIKMNPEHGFTHAGVKIRHGYNLTGDSVIHGNRQWKETYIPAAAFRNNFFTIPDSLMDGNISLIGFMVEVKGQANVDYPVSFDKATAAAADKKVLSIGANINKIGRISFSPNATKAYTFVEKQIPLRLKEFFVPEINYTGGAMGAYLYIDLNQDGQFNTDLDANGVPTYNGELLSYSFHNGKNSLGNEVSQHATGLGTLPKFKISPFIPAGVYRGRLKIDNNNLLPQGSENIIAQGGHIIDFWVNVHHDTHTLTVVTADGSVNSNLYNGLPETTTAYKNIMIAAHGATPNYVAKYITVRHGHELDKEAYVRGNRQWSEYTIPVSGHTIRSVSKDSVNGDVRLTATFTPSATATYKKVFSEEFSTPELGDWNSSKATIVNGVAVLETKDATAATLTSNFQFQYGKIEVRALTSPLAGSAPIIRLRAADGSESSITLAKMQNAEAKTYFSVETPWTKSNSTPTANKSITSPQERYHTYSLEWTPTQLSWSVDGRSVFTYAKTNNPAQWHFDKKYYIEIAQSVSSASAGSTYQTKVDWVRVYQTDDQKAVGISSVYLPNSSENTYDLSGKHTEATSKGVYIVNGQKVLR